MAINPQSITDAVDAINSTGSIADAINTLGSTAPSTLAALGAANTLISQSLQSSPGGRVLFSSFGAAFSYASLTASLSDGEFTVDDVAAASAALASALARSPNPQAQIAAGLFNLYALGVPFLADFGRYTGGELLPQPDEINDLWNQFVDWVMPPRRDPLAIDLNIKGSE
jgi:hypothetical protein